MRKVGHCFARNATEKVNENYLRLLKGDEGEGEGEGRGCPGEAEEDRKATENPFNGPGKKSN